MNLKLYDISVTENLNSLLTIYDVDLQGRQSFL